MVRLRAGAATVVDLAAYLGVTPSRVRQVIAENQIKPVGKRWNAKLYEPRQIIRLASAAQKANRGVR